MKHRLAALVVTAAVFLGAGATAHTAVPPSVGSAAAAKPCGAGWTHASLSWGHKCLRAGQFCKSYKDREYHRYGFHCHTGRLT